MMIREMHKEDIDSVMDIWITSTIKAHPFIGQDYWLKHYRNVKSKYLSVAKTYVAIEDDVIVGFISILKDYFIGALFIIPGRQGRKFGEALLNHGKQLYPTLRAHAYEKNPRAVNFYKRQGFEAIGKQENVDSHFIEYVFDWTK